MLEKLKQFKFYSGWRGNGLPFEVGEGWYDLLYRFSCEVQKLIDTEVESKDLKIVQVKSKYASLRVYTAGNSDEFDSLLDKYVEEAERTCEFCGNPGKVINKGSWLYVCCENCKHRINVT
jgi:hypothetical protein